MTRSLFRAASLAGLCLTCSVPGCAPGTPPAQAPSGPGGASVGAAPSRAAVLAAMKRATRFMAEKVSHHGGYVWRVLPDFSRRWGEMEAYDSMIWVQAPGTSSMGHVLLDAYRATGDLYYYDVAKQAADALVEGQRESGGWNYVVDFAGEESLRRWYETIGRSGWRLEEFQHYYGNSTFDDGATFEASALLLRIYLEKSDSRYQAPLARALDLVLGSQLKNGCWPQRYPMTPAHGALPQFPAHATFNDDVATNNIDLLLMAQRAGDALPSRLQGEGIASAIERAMECFLTLQLPAPNAGWGDQYDSQGRLAAARTYEPAALSTKRTAANVYQLLRFYAFTGDRRFLEHAEPALDWLDSVRQPPGVLPPGHTHPTYVAAGTNEPVYVHRRGSNAANGEYYADNNPAGTIGHSGQTRALDTDGLRQELARVAALPPLEGPNLERLAALPARHDALATPGWAGDLGSASAQGAPVSVTGVLSQLNEAGYWPAEFEQISNPYVGPGNAEPAEGDFSESYVGDRYDTSPYAPREPVVGISTQLYIQNMRALIAHLEASE